MPGIAGIIGPDCPPQLAEAAATMVGSMKHAPFYSSGLVSVPEMGVFAGWTALADSFATGQPFVNDDQSIILLLSGEIFPPASGSLIWPTSWNGFHLINLYEQHGDGFFKLLNGLFSGLLIDKRARKTFLFNDRYGVERLYCHEKNGHVYFASEAKALLRVLPELRAFDPQGVAQFLALGCTIEDKTLFQQVTNLPGSSLWTFEADAVRKSRYFSLATWEAQAPLEPNDYFHALEATFCHALPSYARAPQRLGISLTGGLDTRLIMACLPETAPKAPVCYTFAGVHGETQDARLAKKVAQASNLEHHLLRIRSDFFDTFSDLVDRTVLITDGCFGPTGAHEIYMNAQARSLSPIRLTGNYGSEILRGISTFKPLHLSPGLVSEEMKGLIATELENFRVKSLHPVTKAAFCEIPWSLFGCLSAGRSQVAFRSPYLDNELVKLAFRAPRNLQASRAPVLRLVGQRKPLLANIPTDKGEIGDSSSLTVKVRRALSAVTFKLDYLNNEGLPHWLSPIDPLFRRLSSSWALFGLHKHLHYRTWFRHELAGFVRERTASLEARQLPFFREHSFGQIASDHLRGRGNFVQELNAVLTLEAIQRLLFRSPSDDHSHNCLRPSACASERSISANALSISA